MKPKTTIFAAIACAIVLLVLTVLPDQNAKQQPDTVAKVDAKRPETGGKKAAPAFPGFGGKYDDFANIQAAMFSALDVAYVDYSGGMYEGKVYGEYGDLVTTQMTYIDCRDEENGHTCESAQVFDHPYAAYSFDELSSIAEFDAAASFILGHRIFVDADYQQQYEGDTWYQSGVNMLLNASMLSGTRQPYTTMMSHRKLMILGIVDGQAGWNHLEEIYTWSKAGIELGYLDPTWPAFHAAIRYVESEMTDVADNIFQDLDERAEAIKRYLIDKKAKTTG